MALNYYASSPVVVLPPQQPSQYFAGMSASNGSSSPPRKCPTPPSLNYLAAASDSIVGRKRSIRDVEPEDLPADCPTAVLPKKPEPVYGPGMTLIYPDDPGFSIAAESQTGTWIEEKQEKEEKEAPGARPIAVSRKSQRTQGALSSSPVARSPPSNSIIDENGNTVDRLIAELGIGWKNMMDDGSSSTRAYTRVIENHFPFTNATIMLESAALSAYLVRATEAGAPKFWLFHESLSWCQLLSDTLQGAVNNLKAGPTPAVQGPRITAQRNTPPATPPMDGMVMSAPPASAEDDVMQM